MSKKTDNDEIKFVPKFYFEPKQTPVLDRDGNVIDYVVPKVFSMPYNDSKELRVLSAPAEIGLSADPDNVIGFQATINVLNQCRNTRLNMVAPIGNDDLSVMQHITTTK